MDGMVMQPIVESELTDSDEPPPKKVRGNAPRGQKNDKDIKAKIEKPGKTQVKKTEPEKGEDLGKTKPSGSSSSSVGKKPAANVKPKAKSKQKAKATTKPKAKSKSGAKKTSKESKDEEGAGTEEKKPRRGEGDGVYGVYSKWACFVVTLLFVWLRFLVGWSRREGDWEGEGDPRHQPSLLVFQQ